MLNFFWDNSVKFCFIRTFLAVTILLQQLKHYVCCTTLVPKSRSQYTTFLKIIQMKTNGILLRFATKLSRRQQRILYIIYASIYSSRNWQYQPAKYPICHNFRFYLHFNGNNDWVEVCPQWFVQHQPGQCQRAQPGR